VASPSSVVVINRQRSQRVDRSGLLKFMGRVLELVPPEEASEFAICLVSDRKMREFNRTYRDRDTPTDVLSFPGDDHGETRGQPYLGDIAISVETAARQAQRMEHSLDRELEILALHGYLHLLGYDHERDAGEMMRLQRRVERSLASSSETQAAGRQA
jgi:probable rRNA maturation factor